MIDVFRDTEGVRQALDELFEEDFVRARVDRESAGANDETKTRMQWQIPKRQLSPGYYAFAEYLFTIDNQRRAGITFVSADFTAYEVQGLVALDRARDAFQSRHPACSGCGARQENRFGFECPTCGAKFRRKKGK